MSLEEQSLYNVSVCLYDCLGAGVSKRGQRVVWYQALTGGKKNYFSVLANWNWKIRTISWWSALSATMGLGYKTSHFSPSLESNGEKSLEVLNCRTTEGCPRSISGSHWLPRNNTVSVIKFLGFNGQSERLYLKITVEQWLSFMCLMY